MRVLRVIPVSVGESNKAKNNVRKLGMFDLWFLMILIPRKSFDIEVVAEMDGIMGCLIRWLLAGWLLEMAGS